MCMLPGVATEERERSLDYLDLVSGEQLTLFGLFQALAECWLKPSIRGQIVAHEVAASFGTSE